MAAELAQTATGNSASESTPIAPVLRSRAALEYAIRGDLRFVSHHDEIRMLTRALVRGGWPIAYSQGFNPVPRLSIPLPRSVGVEADRQLAVVELSALQPAAELFPRLARVMPETAPLVSVYSPIPTGTPHPSAAVYEVELPESPPDLEQRMAALKSKTSIVVRREYGNGKKPRPIDIRSWIDDVECLSRGVRMRLRYESSQTARVGEVLTELGLDPAATGVVRRVEVYWDMELCGPDTVRCNREECI